jgi:RES domain
MIPLANRAHEGRVNPKGIPCVYLSDDMHTAMTEVRPWIGSYVSVSELEVKRDLVLVDCTVDGGLPLVTNPEGTPDERERIVWWCMNYAFSEPVTRSDDTADYAPTQVIAEAFRQDGSDGLVYGSKLGTGRTVAVFDLEAANVGKCRVYRVDEVSLKFTDWTVD